MNAEKLKRYLREWPHEFITHSARDGALTDWLELDAAIDAFAAEFSHPEPNPPGDSTK